MKKKVIFLDIDGTLTEPGCNTPPLSAVKAIKAAQKKGNYVFLCTGRNYGMLSPLLVYDFDGVVGCSGGYIVCGDEIIFNEPMPDNQRKKLMQLLTKNGIFRTIETANAAYTDDSFKTFLAEHAGEVNNSELLRWRKQLESDLNIESMSKYKGQDAYKVVIMFEKMEQLDEIKETFRDNFHYVVQEMGNFGFLNGEILSSSYDKGTAVKQVCKHLNIPIEDSIGFGDSMNDLEMLETTGLSICMENGAEALKALADEICPAVSEDGLYKAFEKYGLF